MIIFPGQYLQQAFLSRFREAGADGIWPSYFHLHQNFDRQTIDS